MMRCAFCMHFREKLPDKAFETREGSAIPEEFLQIGRCRRRAPTMAGFPVVFRTDYCGEHKLDENRVIEYIMMRDHEEKRRILDEFRPRGPNP